jgi:tetratricopeptide (TPR) repeat protein
MSTISLCVVARDAAPNLPDCIRSTEGLVDEVVVLDSGKLNGAGEWASSNGAKMIPYQWSGDLAEARTAAVRQASSDWVLMLDADETLSSGAAATIREAINRGGMDCGFLPLVKADGRSSASERLASKEGDATENAPRLMRRTMDLHWDSGDAESVSGWVAMRARRVRSLDAPILKMEESVKAEETKAPVAVAAAPVPTGPVFEAPDGSLYSAPKANEPVVSTDEAQAPTTEAQLTHAWDRYHDNDLEACSDTVEAIWSGLTADHIDAVQVATLRAHIFILTNDYRSALETIGTVLDWGIHHPNMDMLQGVIAENTAMRSADFAHHMECLSRAEAAFAACVTYQDEISARDSLPGVTSWGANTRLGTVRLAQGNVDGARVAFEAALESDPEHAEATLGLMECRLETGDGAAIIEPLMPFMESNIADAWMLAATACEEMGRVDDALLFTQRAHELQQNGLQVSAHRDFRMAELISMAGLYVGKPLVGPGAWGAIGAIVARQPMSTVSVAKPVDGPKVVRFVTHCSAAGWTDVIESMLEPRAEQVAPGMGDIVRRTLQALGATSEAQESRSPVFIGGTWDSGVRTMQGMLDGHTGLEAGEETKLIPLMCSLRNEWWDSMAPDLEAAGIGEKQLDGAVKAFIQTLMAGAAPSKAMRSVETTPHTLLHMETMASIFPRARFVHVVRDGRDVVGSLLQRDWVDPSTGDKVWCCQSPKAAAEYWVHVVDAIREQGARIPGRYLEVQYEDLIAHPEASMRMVLAFLGETWEDAVLQDIVAEPEIKVPNEEVILAAIEGTPRCAPQIDAESEQVHVSK